MRALSLLIVAQFLFVQPSLLCAGVQGVAEKVTRSVYNEAGLLTHRIIADRVTYGAGLPRCDNTKILFLDPADPSKVIQTVWAKVAFYDQSQSRVFGPSEVKTTSSDLEVTATGFDLELNSSRLMLEHDVVAHAESADLFCRSAVLLKSKEKPDENDKLSRLERLEASGDVRLVNKKPGKRTWDEALSDFAFYERKTGLLVCPHGAKALLEGKEVLSDSSFEHPFRE